MIMVEKNNWFCVLKLNQCVYLLEIIYWSFKYGFG